MQEKRVTYFPALSTFLILPLKKREHLMFFADGIGGITCLDLALERSHPHACESGLSKFARSISMLVIEKPSGCLFENFPSSRKQEDACTEMRDNDANKVRPNVVK